MTVAEAINRACDEAEKFDEACRIARQQAEAINELCAWTDELKAYRETGLTPEEVTALQASNQELKKEALPILQAKVQDRLVILPCGLGGTVYANFAQRGDYLREKDKPYPCEVVFIGLSKEPFLHIQFKNGRVFPVKFCEVGKTVFTTREAALKEKEG